MSTPPQWQAFTLILTTPADYLHHSTPVSACACDDVFRFIFLIKTCLILVVINRNVLFSLLNTASQKDELTEHVGIGVEKDRGEIKLDFCHDRRDN